MSEQAQHNSIPVVTVDGPAGAGKGTLSERLAAELGWHMLDSGAIYRVAAHATLKHDLALNDTAKLAEFLSTLDMQCRSGQIISYDTDVTEVIRTPECAGMASKVAAIPEVRAVLLERQRAFQQFPGLVADGRDMGTVVFPAAPAKIFLTASPEVRGARRHKQLSEQGISANLPDLIRDIAERDARDANRETAPLRPAADALLLDSSQMSIDNVVQTALDYIHSRINQP